MSPSHITHQLVHSKAFEINLKCFRARRHWMRVSEADSLCILHIICAPVKRKRDIFYPKGVALVPSSFTSSPDLVLVDSSWVVPSDRHALSESFVTSPSKARSPSRGGNMRLLIPWHEEVRVPSSLLPGCFCLIMFTSTCTTRTTCPERWNEKPRNYEAITSAVLICYVGSLCLPSIHCCSLVIA